MRCGASIECTDRFGLSSMLLSTRPDSRDDCPIWCSSIGGLDRTSKISEGIAFYNPWVEERKLARQATSDYLGTSTYQFRARQASKGLARSSFSKIGSRCPENAEDAKL